MIPGSNLLLSALRVIAPQTVQYYAFESRSTNALGYDVATYANPIDLQGSVQALDRKLYQVMGLDLQGYYVNFYTPKNVIDVARDVSGDHMIYNGRQFQFLSRTDWFGQDGWEAILCVQVPLIEAPADPVVNSGYFVVNAGNYVVNDPKPDNAVVNDGFYVVNLNNYVANAGI